MLILSRKIGDRIVFTVTEPTTFELRIVGNKGNCTKLGIEAGQEVQVARPESLNQEPKIREVKP